MQPIQKTPLLFLAFLIIFSITSVNCFAENIHYWSELEEPFNKMIEVKGKKECVEFSISERFYNQISDLDLSIESKVITFLRVNHQSIFQAYRLDGGDNLISIEKKYLKIGANRLCFSDFDQLHSDARCPTCGPEIYQIELKNAALTKSKMINPDAIAVVIGNQTYSHRDVPEVEFAFKDAYAIRNFLTEYLGYRDGNILFVTDASKAKLETLFGNKDNHKGLLYDYIKPEKSDVFIYYSGHGSPSISDNRAYFLPIDCIPSKLELTGYPLDTLYQNLSKLDANNITVVIDACFSGGTNTGSWLVKSASPALIKVATPLITNSNITVLTSAKGNQISSWYPEKQHSMFTYFFLTAARGSADTNNNKQITYQEIFDFVADRAEGVPYYAKRLHGGRIQNPTMQAANKDAVFVKF